MKITKKIQQSIVKDPTKLTKREFYILTALAENEIREWTNFFNNLNNEYAKQTKTSEATKGRATNKKSSRVNR